MNYPLIFSFFVISLTKDIPTTHSTTILRNRNVSPELVNVAFRGAFLSAKSYQMEEMEYKIDSKSDGIIDGLLQNIFGGFFGTKTTTPTISANSDLLKDIFGTKIIFHDVNFYFHREDDCHSTHFHLIPQNGNDQLAISIRKLRITLEVGLRREKNEPRSRFELSLFTTLHFENFVLNVTRTNEMKFDFDLSYGNYYVWNHGFAERIRWCRFKLDFPNSGEEELTREITPILPLLLREHINRDPGFSQAFDLIIAKSF